MKEMNCMYHAIKIGVSVECLNLESLIFVTSGEMSVVTNVPLGNPQTHRLLLPD
jgi:hypothetical protein